MHKIYFYISTLLFLILPHNSFAAAKISVAAIVGEEVVTTYDLQQRLKIFTAGSKLKMNEQNKKALLQQIRELLIVEKLKVQAAEALSITVSDAEIEQSLDKIAKANNVSLDELSDFIESQGLSFLSIYNRIKAELLWDRLVRSKISPQVNVSEAEIAESKRIFLAKQEQIEVKYDFLSYKFSDTESKNLAEEFSYKIYRDLASNKLDFANVKNSENAIPGEAKEWESLSKLKPSIQAQLNLLGEGEVSEPFTLDKEILIVKLIARREIKAADDKNLEQKIMNNLFLSKLENQVSAYLRDIESSYYIERKKI